MSDPRPATLFSALSVEETAARLEVDPERGLTAAEVVDRRRRFGRNEIEEGRRRGPIRIFFEQFRDFMIGVLVVAAIVAGIVGEPGDALAIVAIVALNAALGTVQELRADRAIEALQDLTRPQARACRDGVISTRASDELVPGDVVCIEAGDVVPADLRLVANAELQIEEAALTGESVPTDKTVAELAAEDASLGDLHNLAYRGTLVTRGQGRGLVIATGMETELGRVASLLDRPRLAAPLQRRLADFGRRLSAGVLALCGLIFVLGLMRGEEPGRMFLTAVAMAVAAIPEALPAVVTISLALGSRLMVARNALVRHLPATEALGSVTVICSDKTGTLTQNRMRVEAFYTPQRGWSESLPSAAPASPVGGDDRAVRGDDCAVGGDDCAVGGDGLFALALAVSNDVRFGNGSWLGDPTEIALVETVASSEAERADRIADAPRLASFPFDPTLKRMSTLHRTPSGPLALVKGAPEVVQELCTRQWNGSTDEPLAPSAVREAAREAASRGQRVIAFAYSRPTGDAASISRPEAESDLTFLGLTALIDPPRPEAAEAVALCRSAGIRPIMITGDHPETALAIAKRLGIAGEEARPVIGSELSRLQPREAADRICQAQVFARVSPEQKIQIVEALQRSGELVAMTGDGVNDAPALRRADIGVAMGVTGTDVAREAADMVLLDDNFATIVAAVGEGRRIFDNIRKFVRYTLTSNSGELWTLLLAPFFGFPVPLLPVQILWINLVTDGLPGLALSSEPAEPGVMRRGPRSPDESIFSRGLWQHMLVIGLLIGAICLGVLAWGAGGGSDRWQTLVFTVLTLCQLAHALAIRSERESLFRQGLLSNRPLLGAVALTLGLQLAVVYLPWMQPIFHTEALTLGELGICLALPVLVFAAVEVEKWLVRSGRLYASGPGSPAVR